MSIAAYKISKANANNVRFSRNVYKMYLFIIACHFVIDFCNWEFETPLLTKMF